MSTGLKSADVLKQESKQQSKKAAKRIKKVRRGLSVAVMEAAILSKNGDGEPAFAEWSRYLQKRKSPVPLQTLISADGESPLAWCVPKSQRKLLLSRKWFGGETWDTLTVGEATKQADAWLSSSTTPDATGALDALAWCYRLPNVAHILPRTPWNEILNELIRLARQASIAKLGDRPWAAQLILCELPMALGYHFPEVADCADLLPSAATQLSESLIELCDGQGMVSANHVAVMHPLLACWTRCMTMVRAAKRSKIHKDARHEFGWFVRNVLRLTRVDGGVPFEPINVASAVRGLDAVMRAAIRLSGDDEDAALAKVVLRKRSVAQRSLPDDPGYHSDWAQIAVLQPEWETDQPRLTVDFSDPRMRVELMARGELLFSTPWHADILIDGVALPASSDAWETTCWFSDFDVDCLELEQQLSAEWKLQRQFLMARQDHFLLFTDSVIGPETSQIEYRLSLPCSAGISCEGAAESREGLLRGRRPLAAVLPIGLPEWRSDPRHGELRFSDNQITLMQKSYGKALTVPLFFDFHRSRMKKPITWRQLTVAENLQIVTRDQAVGYRIQVGVEQWIVYRSLTEVGNRTLIGQNFSSEFICARFLDDGEIESLVEIE